MKKDICKIDKNFKPIYLFNKDFYSKLTEDNSDNLHIALERNDGYRYCYSAKVFCDNPETDELNFIFAERLIKSILWIAGGYKLYLNCPDGLFNRLKNAFSHGGSRDFDVKFFERVYGQPFEVIRCENDIPAESRQLIKTQKKSDGARIGFDAGGSDRKVCAVLNGEVLYSEEVIWYPKTQSDPNYHYGQIKEAITTAASYLPHIDSIGVSSAGIYVNNQTRVASLFLKVPEKAFDEKIKNIYIDIAKEFNAPLTVANDGDVAAIAGAIELETNSILGIAMGTSEAAGFIDDDGNLWGWLNELAFVPVDVFADSAVDEWSGDYGTGVKYLSQDGAILLAKKAGIELDYNLSPANKLKAIQALVNAGDSRAEAVFYDIGTYLGYSTLYYWTFYKNKNLLLMGRVASGRGGEIIVNRACEILKEYENETAVINLVLPDEKSRRVGQAVAAANL